MTGLYAAIAPLALLSWWHQHTAAAHAYALTRCAPGMSWPPLDRDLAAMDDVRYLAGELWNCRSRWADGRPPPTPAGLAVDLAWEEHVLGILARAQPEKRWGYSVEVVIREWETFLPLYRGRYAPLSEGQRAAALAY
jgi:hypothetical protein